MTGPPLLNTGQLNIITYLFIFLLPIIIISLLMRSVLPKNPMSLRFLKTTIFRGTPWAFREHQGPIWCRRRKVKTKVKNRNPETTATTRHWLRAHLFAFTMASLKVGCQVESSLRCLRQSHRFHIHAIASIQGDLTSGQVWTAAACGGAICVFGCVRDVLSGRGRTSRTIPKRGRDSIAIVQCEERLGILFL
jgi:hypothetical protein